MGVNETVPTSHGFLDGCYLHQDAYGGAATLVSFHFVRFILFTVMFTVAGPAFYRIFAAFFDLERDFKSIADHFDDATNGLIYTYIVFTLGNYAHTFSWVTVVFYFTGIVVYSALVELPFMRVSLNTLRSWGSSTWAVTLTGLALVLVGAGFHIRWAYTAGILAWYLPLFLLATASVWSPVIVQMLHHYCIDNCPNGLGMERHMRRLALVLFTRRNARNLRKQNEQQSIQLGQLRTRAEEYAANPGPSGAIVPSSAPTDMYSVASTRQNNANKDETISLNTIHPTDRDSHESSEGDSDAEANRIPNNSNTLLNMPNEPEHQQHIDSLTREQKNDLIEKRLKNLHYLNVSSDGTLPLHRYQLHLHHWQMFYILAFFTRFDKFVSHACAGIVLGIVTQGSAAYGFDAMMNPKG
ncbi:hypothetical protein GGI26_004324 [Coemansia sp. RSA 1358]|nr:hypothetical protein GGI26_004324 [Coemansia sp. RSA 1358]